MSAPARSARPDVDAEFARVVAELTRRGFLAGGVGAATLTGLAGCGASGSARPESTAGSGTAFPVAVAGKEGVARLSHPPKRVVAVGYLRDTDLAIGLGAPLVGVVGNQLFPSGLAPWQHPRAKPTVLHAAGSLPIEKIAALHPDLILASDDYTLNEHYGLLARIAPTLSYRKGIGEDGWQLMTTRAGQVLGRTAEAARAVASVEAQLARVRAEHPEFAGKTFTTGPVTSPSQFFTVSSTRDASARFYASLGLVLSPKVTSLPPSSTPGRSLVSPERLDLLDADVLILGYATPQIRRQVEADPLFRKLKAVRRGSYVAGDLKAPSTGFPSILSIPYGLHQMVPKLAAALKRG